MTTELEDRIRASLQQRGETIHVEVPEPDLTRRFAAKSRTRRLELAAVAAALALFVGAGLLVALAGRESSAPPSSDYLTPTATATTPERRVSPHG
jgi:ferric-dicitrate binding protein FerR (iron transport regulator)